MMTDVFNFSTTDAITIYATAADDDFTMNTTIDNTANITADVFDYDVTTTSSKSVQFSMDRAELCRRLSPPPIPPWLLDSPEKLRLLVVNCSSWQRYMDLCSLQVPPEYPHALAEHTDSGNIAVQWIPFIIVVLLIIFIVVSVIVIYSLYRTKRMKFDFFAEYHKPGHHYQNYCDQGSYMTPSVTVESQLSVCALEDDSFAAIIPSHVAYNDLAHGRGRTNIVRSPGISGRSAASSLYDLPHCQSLLSREIILHPDTLSDDDLQTPLYVSDLSGSDYYSSHSLPIDSDNEKIQTRSKHKRSKGVVTTHQGELGEEEYDSPYVQIHRGKTTPKPSIFARVSQLQPHKKSERGNSNHHNHNSKRGSVRGVVQRCRKAGASLVHGVIWNRGQGHDQGQQPRSNSEHARAPLSLGRLRQSFHNIRMLRHKPCRRSSCLDIAETPPGDQTSAQLVMSPSSEIERNTSLSPSAHAHSSVATETQDRGASIPIASNAASCNDKSSLAGARLKTIGHFLRHGPRIRTKGMQDKEISQPRTSSTSTIQHHPNQDQSFTYVNEAFEGHDSSGDGRQKKSPFRRIRMPSVLKKMGKNRDGN